MEREKTPKRIYLSSPHMGGGEIAFIQEALDTNWIAPLGPNVDAFERECATHVGVTSALALSSGTAAALLAGRLLGITEGDIVFCSSLTFVATIAPLVQLGASPVFIDSEPNSWNLSPLALERALVDAQKRGTLPKLVVLVNLYGQSCDMDALLPLCERYGVPVLEDAAESMGARCNGRPSGSFGRFGFFSFNGNKIITTSGGGMLLSNSAEDMDKARFWATQARDKAPWYQHSELGYNFRMSNVLAGIGRGQLRVLEDRVCARRAVFERYQSALADFSEVDFMPEPKWSHSSRWLTTLTINSELSSATPMELITALSEENIEARPVWKPMHLQPIFQNAPYFQHKEEEDVSRALFESGLCLPSGSNLTEEEQARVVSVVRGVLGRARKC